MVTALVSWKVEARRCSTDGYLGAEGLEIENVRAQNAV
jgi:hypothetical protein